MAIVDISSTLDGEAALSAEASAIYSANATQAGSSTQMAAANAIYAASSSPSGDSVFDASTETELLGTSSFPGSSTVSATANVAQGVSVTAGGSSSLEADATVQPAISATMSGGSGMTASATYAQLSITANMVSSSELLGDATFLGAYGDDSYGGSPYGGALPPFGLESAVALSATQVRVRYTAMVNAGFPLLLSISNYSISPAVTISSVVLESAQSVLLNTSPLSAPVYTLTIADALGYLGQPLAPALNSAEFAGMAAGPTFYAVATARRRVRAVFSVPMFSNAALTDPAQYVLTDLSGDPILISSVVAEQLTDVRSTVLLLGEDLADERHYRLTLLGGIVSQDLAAVSPDTSMFQWVENTLRAQIPVAQFSGEVMEGLFGIHGGLVFFSPALENAAANSIIQVEQVDVCTRAYDEYHFPPQVIDPSPLLTHGAGLVPTPVVSTLNSAAWVLWATFPRLIEAKFELGMGSSTAPLEDLVAPPVDAVVEISLTESWPPDRVAILNNTDWKLFDNLGNPPAYFITADNLTPFPHPVTVLSFTMFGGSTQEAEADLL